MHTQKIAITIPQDILATIDEISQGQKISRSKFISAVLKEKIQEEKNKQIRHTYDRVFDDETIRKEQMEWVNGVRGPESEEGVEW